MGQNKTFICEVQLYMQNTWDVILSENETLLLTNIKRRGWSRKVLQTIAKFHACSQNNKTSRYCREADTFYDLVKTSSRKLNFEEATFLLKPKNFKNLTSLGLVSLAEEIICQLVSPVHLTDNSKSQVLWKYQKNN